MDHFQEIWLYRIGLCANPSQLRRCWGKLTAERSQLTLHDRLTKLEINR